MYSLFDEGPDYHVGSHGIFSVFSGYKICYEELFYIARMFIYRRSSVFIGCQSRMYSCLYLFGSFRCIRSFWGVLINRLQLFYFLINFWRILLNFTYRRHQMIALVVIVIIIIQDLTSSTLVQIMDTFIWSYIDILMDKCISY